jgi:acyl carrier protein
MVRMGYDRSELTGDLDLVRSGVLDSLGFVDLVADLVTLTGRDVDLEAALGRKNVTTVDGLLALFPETRP